MVCLSQYLPNAGGQRELLPGICNTAGRRREISYSVPGLFWGQISGSINEQVMNAHAALPIEAAHISVA